MTITEKIAFIGAGQMAQALARGFVASGLAESKQLIAFDPSPEAGKAFAKAAPDAAFVSSGAEAAAAADVVFLAVKPQVIDRAMADVRSAASSALFVSIAAGVTLARLSQGLATKRLARVMPNTPCLVGRSASAYAFGEQADDNDRQLVAALLQAVGLAIPLEEKLLDAVTGLSGSGPAFVYIMIEALADGGVRMGLPREAASALAAQTVLGAAQMVRETGEHPAVLKDRVASPGGTTIAGIQALEREGLRSALMSAVEAATLRSIELGAAKASS